MPMPCHMTIADLIAKGEGHHWIHVSGGARVVDPCT